jgi:oligopeptide transport system ATP-binding protein
VRRGETIGLVGESGCGKSTLGRTLIRLYEPTAGEIAFEGKNFLKESGSSLRALRKDIQMIFQDPYASLDPRMTVGQIIGQPFDIHGTLSGADKEKRVKELLEKVGLRASHINRYPHEFSGGQRQRICIARAIALNPKLIICDEPVSALDVSILQSFLLIEHITRLLVQRNMHHIVSCLLRLPQSYLRTIQIQLGSCPC